MTAIWIDPAELSDVAVLLRSVTDQLSGLTGSIASDCCCGAPPQIAELVDSEVSAVRSGLVSTQQAYGQMASDLSDRARLTELSQTLAGAIQAAYGSAPAQPADAGGLNWVDDMTARGASDPSGQPGVPDASGWTSDLAARGAGIAPTAEWTSGAGWVTDMAARNTATAAGADPSVWVAALPASSRGQSIGILPVSPLGLGAAASSVYPSGSASSPVTAIWGGPDLAANTLAGGDYQVVNTREGTVYVDPAGHTAGSLAGARDDGHGHFDLTGAS